MQALLLLLSLNSGIAGPAPLPLRNPDFRVAAPGGLAEGWSAIGAYRLLPRGGPGGRAALEMASDGSADRGAVQIVRLAPPREGAFAVTAWMRCDGVGEGGDCCLWLDVLQEGGPPIWGATGQPDRARPGWQRVRAIVLPSHPVREVSVHLLLRKARGRVRFAALEVQPIRPVLSDARVWRQSARDVQVAARLSDRAAWVAVARQAGREVSRATGVGHRVEAVLSLPQAGPAEVSVSVPASGKPPARLALAAWPAAGAYDTWVAGAEERVFEDDLPPIPPSAAAAVDMARNERESFQVCLRARPPAVPALDALVAWHGDPRGVRAEVRRVGYVRVEKPFQHPFAERRSAAWWPDPLLPMAPRDAPAGVTRAFWVTVHTPMGAPAGERRGEVVLRSRGALVARVPFRVRVHPVTLPIRAHMKTAFALMDAHLRKLYGEITPRLRRAYTDLLLDHRLNPDDISRTEPPDLDELAYAASRGLNAFNVLNVVPEAKPGQLWVCWAPLEEYTPSFRERFLARLAAIVPELRRRGLLRYAYVYGFDERGPEYIPVIRDLFGEIRRRWPGLRTLSTCWPPPGTDPLSLNIDWFVPLSSSYDHALAQRVRARGGEMWWYVCMGPNHPYANWLLENPLIEARVIWWQAAKYGVEGMLYWGLNIWERANNDAPIPDDADPHLLWSVTTASPYDWLNGDGVLLYPGVDGPIPSVRLAAIRDGIEDTELLRLAESRDPVAARAALGAVVTDRTRYTRDPRALAEARRRLLRTLSRPQPSSGRLLPRGRPKELVRLRGR